MKFSNIFRNIIFVSICVNIASSFLLTVLLKTGLYFAGLIANVARKPLVKNSQCGWWGSCTVRVYNELSSGTINVVCRSSDDTIGPKDLAISEQINFQFGRTGSDDVGFSTQFWCTVSIPGSPGTVTFDVWNGDAPLFDNHWMVRDEGVYLRTDPLRPEYDNALYYEYAQGGDNQVRLNSASYTLWDAKDENNNPTGNKISDFVDNNGCKNVPADWNDRASAVTVCDFDCVILYQWEDCRGETSRRQADGAGCTNFYLTFFDKRTSAVGGCHKANSGKALIPLAVANS